MDGLPLREQVLAANLALPAHGLVTLTWGNVSGIDRERGLVAIKPSGVAYESMTLADIVVVDLDGNVVEGERRPSTDTPTHLELYRACEWIGGIVHTHSPWATSWAQAEREIPVLGTTHADLSARPIPLTRALTPFEVDEDYEGATGRALVEATTEHDTCALVRGHGPFAWGASPAGRGRGGGDARAGRAHGAGDDAAGTGRAAARRTRSAASTSSASTARTRTTGSDRRRRQGALDALSGVRSRGRRWW